MGRPGAGSGSLVGHGPVSHLSVSLGVVRFKSGSMHKRLVNSEALGKWKVLF